MRPPDQQPQREANEQGSRQEDERRKRRIPAEPIPQRPDELPIGNGGTDQPAAFPPHN